MQDLKELNEFVEQELKEVVTGNFHWIKDGEQQIRLFKSLANRRLDEQGETFGEYKVRLKINKQMVKLHKRGSVTSNI